MEDIPRIVAIRGPYQGREHPIDRQIYTLGRGKHNSLQIAWDVSISRRHARILQYEGLFWLEDLESINGTCLTTPEGKQIALQPHAPHMLLSTATFSLGKHACFEVLGTVASIYVANRVVEAQMDRLIQALQIILPMLPLDERDELLTDCVQLAKELQSTQPEADILLIAARFIQAISESQAVKIAQTPVSLPSLPLPPADLPLPDTPSRLLFLINHLIDSLKNVPLRNASEESELSI